MEEGRWAARVLSEIGSARASIAANYLALWRKAGQLSDAEQSAPGAAGAEEHGEGAAPASSTLDSCDTDER
jgi:hypothetical protein